MAGLSRCSGAVHRRVDLHTGRLRGVGGIGECVGHNHDPAQRLEAPEAVLKELGVHVLGTLRRGAEGVDLDRHLIALRDRHGAIRAHVLAVPFLRQADLPGLRLGAEDGDEPAITAAVRALHREMTEAAVARVGGLPLLAMGHLTCSGGLASDGAERRILIGGEHAVPPDVFPGELAYVALGHLHRPQSLDGGRVRYSGSAFPLSASEIAYDHGVTLIDLSDGVSHRHIPIDRPVPMFRLPPSGSGKLEDMLAALAEITLSSDTPRDKQPFLYLSLIADRPVTMLAAEIETLMERTPARLAGLSITRSDQPAQERPPATLAETSPEDLFLSAFQEVHGTPPDAHHLAAFRDALSEA
ncbi:nuclease SbcCD subunit D [mine drainage metagenome]|uniref:Nuclease SbcCD subunit D n=1 Tax=mine drainage metagenome TaxID=410659 RepID=A0A1J5QLD3_9ZZZZ